MDRVQIVHENFLRRVAGGDLPRVTSDSALEASGLSHADLLALYRAQVMSRHLDIMSRKLQARGEGYYTIGSSGHEGNAGIAAAVLPTDPAFLHYRDAAFQIARSFQVPGQTPLWDALLSFVTSSDDPISGGRHKVLGSKALNIPPQTSTIASHLPKAVGAAYSIALAQAECPEYAAYPDDAIALCSFGDASLNHSTAQGALNTAGWTAHQNVPMPILFVCEDNGIGISVKSPPGWVEASLKVRAGLAYFSCNGLDVVETHAAAARAAAFVRGTRKPAILHMRCIRLYGHAGADAQQAYLSTDEISQTEAKDPLLMTVARLVRSGACTAADALEIYKGVDTQVARIAEDAISRPKLTTSAEVMASIIPPKRQFRARTLPDADTQNTLLGPADRRAIAEPQHMAKLINFALTDLMHAYPEVVVAGEDVGKKGGVYGVTQRLHERFGPRRVVDTLLDEQSILGLAIGLGQNGFLPMPEIQFLAYLHNAEDQLRGEAATQSFFSNGQYTNPMVIRVAGLAYQRGFGGHFHNDNSLAVLRDIPGVIMACPSNGRDAALMLRECVRLALEEQRVVAFIEPIALYMTRDLHRKGDGLWTHHYPDQGALPVGEVGVIGDGRDVAIVSYANGFYLSCQAQKKLAVAHGIDARVIDLRWLAPLPEAALLDAVAGCRHVLVVDECRRTGSQSEALMTLFAEDGRYAASRLAAEDSFIPTGPSYAATLPGCDDIVDAVLRQLRPGIGE